ncbi:MAG: transposase-like zinc-binding domain-containing protein [Candidatus Hadarchaeum sp.]|uniref:transposase-like zinc-binding domain-containing protein n=1 Tax=Candidatus Hadarchaeum sp. TaxID=2883567 RepID=UPI003D136F1C
MESLFVEVEYAPPEGRIRAASVPTCRFRIICEDEEMQRRADFVGRLDPRLGEDEVVGLVVDSFGRPLCPSCGAQLVKNGVNGSGTPQYRCNACERDMAFHAVFEAVTFRALKTLTALTMVIHCQTTVEDAADFLGLSRNVLWENLWRLPDFEPRVSGKPMAVSHRKERVLVVNLDGLHRGESCLLLTVSGERKNIGEGNERTMEGLEELLDGALRGMEADRYLFVTDTNRAAIRWLIERYGEKAVVVAQNHTLWGDAMVYFHHGGWWTLRLRTDSFTTPTPKRNEARLLPPGVIELYEGLKGTNPVLTLRNHSTEALEAMGASLLEALRALALELRSRTSLEGLFLMMLTRVRELNSVIKELRRRGVSTIEENARRVMSWIAELYGGAPGAKRKRLLMNAWKHLKAMPEEVESLGRALLGSWSTKEEEAEKPHGAKKKTARATQRARLVYRGPVEEARQSLSEEARGALEWILSLLRKVFDGREITNNPCEGEFSVTGDGVRRRRSAFPLRAIGYAYLRRNGLHAVAFEVAAHFSMSRMGGDAPHRGRVQLRKGGTYLIIYRNREGEVSRKTVTVLRRLKGRVVALCHEELRKKHLSRRRVLHATPL